MQINPYLTFDGNAREAMEFYHAILGGSLTVTSFGDMPPQDWVTDDNRHLVANAQLRFGDHVLMASDSAGFSEFRGHSGFDIQLGIDDLEAARTAYERLAEGGSRIMDFAPTFWAAGFGTLRDRFGVPWMVNCDL